jgi:hypothetical protein
MFTPAGDGNRGIMGKTAKKEEYSKPRNNESFSAPLFLVLSFKGMCSTLVEDLT